jgi:hypothetical protein
MKYTDEINKPIEGIDKLNITSETIDEESLIKKNLPDGWAVTDQSFNVIERKINQLVTQTNLNTTAIKNMEGK